MAKRRAKELSTRMSESDDESGDPAQPLNDRELRSLYKAYTKYGSLDECRRNIEDEAQLKKRDPSVIKSTIEEWERLSEEAIQRHRSAHEDAGKKEKKAILFDYKGVRKLNAETILFRPYELKILRRAVEAFGQERTKFRINDVKLVHNWSCEWGTREDSMLCVGIVKHGYGAWAQIRDDPELGMHNKLFLEENRVDKKEERGKGETTAKSPGAVHLVRRADYLLGVLKERVEQGLNQPPRRPQPDARPKNLKRNRSGSSVSPVPPKKSKSTTKPTLSDAARSRDKEHSKGAGSKKRRSDRDEHDHVARTKHRPSLEGCSAPVDSKKRRNDRDHEDPGSRKKQRPSLDGNHVSAVPQPEVSLAEELKRVLTQSEQSADVCILTAF
jgi:chromodomain-helicase-DNA-binding protein 1